MLIDFHAHPDKYKTKLKEALSEIRQEKILTIANSMDITSYERNQEIAKACEFVIPIFGIHPWNAPDYADSLEQLGYFVEQSPMIGEVGLDYYFIKDSSCYPAQKKILEFFLSEAHKTDKIVSLHTKGAEEDIYEFLNHQKLERVVIHWYSGPLDMFQKLLKIGVYFTIGPEVLKSLHIQEIARKLPLDRLLVETDNPGGPESLFGEQGMPRLLKDVVRKVAQLRQEEYKKIVEIVRNNIIELARHDSWLKKVSHRPYK